MELVSYILNSKRSFTLHPINYTIRREIEPIYSIGSAIAVNYHQKSSLCIIEVSLDNINLDILEDLKQNIIEQLIVDNCYNRFEIKNYTIKSVDFDVYVNIKISGYLNNIMPNKQSVLWEEK